MKSLHLTQMSWGIITGNKQDEKKRNSCSSKKEDEI